MLKVNEVYAGYDRSEVLRGVSFEVPKGQVTTLIGANGAGKTTTLRCVSGQLGITSGQILLNGEDISQLRAHEVVAKGITMVPEGRQLFPFLTVRDNLLIGSYKKAARAQADERLAHVLEIFPQIADRLNQLAGSLSGGEQQMVAIARGMMSDPDILMFDEPSLGLSPLLVEQMFAVIETIIQEGITVLLVEQNVYNTLQLADYGYVLENGEIVLSGTGTELLNNPHVKTAYLGV